MPPRGTQQQELHRALLSAYPTLDGLRRMLQFGLDVGLDEVAGGITHSDIVFNLIRWAASQGRVDDLVRAAREDNPGNADLAAFARDFLPQTEDPALREALADYRAAVALEYRDADYRGVAGIARPDQQVFLPFDDLYVEPRLVRDRERAGARDRGKELLHTLTRRSEDLDPREYARCVEEYNALTGEVWRPDMKPDIREQKEPAGKPLGEALASVPRAVLLGMPGVGKTALTRYLARTCALGPDAVRERLGWDEDRTTVLLSIAAFADARRTRPSLSLPAFLLEKMESRGGEPLRRAVEREMRDGRLFIELDGVDEVPDYAARAAVVQEVDRFIRESGANRVLITSRPYGYIPLAGDLPHFHLPNFSSEQVESFVRRWQDAGERSLHPQAPDLDRARREADATLAEIRRHPKVAELATNPLMLVIISLLRREHARLPEQRVLLYHRAVNTLMETWNQWRSQPGVDVGGATLPLRNLVPVWAAVAAWTRREKPTGVMHRAELKRKLVEVLKEKELDENAPGATAESYLNAAAHRAGLLEERGTDVFAFWHPTFEEYLAAVHLATPASRAKERLMPLREDPRWREVILLAVGYLGAVQQDPDTATEVVEALGFERPGPLERLLYPHLRLAAACIADDVGVRRTLAQQVLRALAAAISEFPYGRLEPVFVDTVRAVPRLRPSADTIAALAPLIGHKHWKVRRETARLLCQVATDDDTARYLCRRLLEDGEADVRCQAGLALLRAGDYRLEVWQALVHFQSTEAEVKEQVSDFLRELPENGRVALSTLLGAEPELRLRAANLLRAMGHEKELAEAALLLLSAEDPNLRFEGANGLWAMGREEEPVVKTYLSLLTTGGPYLRFEAANRLRAMGREEELAQVALSLLRAEDEGLRMWAANLLRAMGREGERVVQIYLSLLTTEDPPLRLHAVVGLRAMGREDELTQAALSLLIAEDPILRFEGANGLRGIGREEERVVTTYLSLLSTEDPSLRFEAANQLREMRREEEQAVTTYLSLLSADDPNVRFAAANGLRAMGREEEPMVKALLSLLCVENLSLRFAAANRLRSMGHLWAGIEMAVRSVQPEDAEALRVCRRVLEGPPLSENDATLLAELTRAPRTEAEEPTRGARQFVYEWLWDTLTRAEQNPSAT